MKVFTITPEDYKVELPADAKSFAIDVMNEGFSFARVMRIAKSTVKRTEQHDGRKYRIAALLVARCQVLVVIAEPSEKGRETWIAREVPYVERPGLTPQSGTDYGILLTKSEG